MYILQRGFVDMSAAGQMQQRNQRPLAIIGMIDDEPNIFVDIVHSLDVNSKFLFYGFSRIHDIGMCRVPHFDLWIVDVNYNDVPQVYEVLGIIQKKWPTATIVILSNYADMLEGRVVDSVFECISKPMFLNNPTLLRAAVANGMRARFSRNRLRRESVLNALLRHDPSISGHADEVRLIRCGDTTYPLTQPVPTFEQDGRYSLLGLQKYIFGVGESHSDRRSSFSRAFHREFQRLSVKTVEEMDDTESVIWDAISKIIDLAAFQASLSVTIPNEIGRVVNHNNELGVQIEWYGGDHGGEVNWIAFENGPAELATIGVGDWIFTSVVRLLKTGAPIRVNSVSPTRSPMLTQQERDHFWDSLDSWEDK